MNLRLLPWAAMALLVLGLAIRSALPTDVAAVLVETHGTVTGGAGPEIRIGSVDLRELHDDGTWNRLDADEAVYGYGNRTVSASGVTVFLGEGAPFPGTTIRAPSAVWNLDRKTIALSGGCRATRQDGWTGDLSAGMLDLAGFVLRVPGPARLDGPGVFVQGKGLAWNWAEGRISMESTRGRIAPLTGPGRRG